MSTGVIGRKQLAALKSPAAKQESKQAAKKEPEAPKTWGPRVLINFNKHTAIEVAEKLFKNSSPKNSLIICMDASGLAVSEISPGTLEREWKVLDYPPHLAAARYLSSTKNISIDPGALFYLRRIIMQYIFDKTGGTVHVGNAKEVKVAFGALPEEQRLGDAVIVKSAEDLKVLSLSALANLYNSVVEDDEAVKKFGKKDDKTVQKVWDAVELNYDPKVQAQAEKAAAAAAKAEAKEAAAAEKGAAKGTKKDAAAASTGAPREGSKMGNLVAHLQKGGESTLEELSEASGYDLNNTRTAIGILRSKKGMSIDYNRETKVYSLAA